MEDKKLIGQRIREARQKLNLSQDELGKLMDVASQSVQQWESGKSFPRAHRMRRLASTLKTSPNWLQFGTGHSTNENFDNIVGLIGSEEFKMQVASSFTKTLQNASKMGWIQFKRSDVTLATVTDLFMFNLMEEYGVDVTSPEDDETNKNTATN